MDLIERMAGALERTAPVAKGALFPFNVVPPLDGSFTGERLKRPFAESTWIMAAVKRLAQPLQAVPLDFYRGPQPRAARRAASAAPLDDPRLSEFWAAPAIGLPWADFIEATVGWLKLAGESFWLLDDSTFAPFPDARAAWPQMILARPDRMRHIVDQGKLTAWEFADAAGQRHVLLPEQVVHLKQWNPYDYWRGLGEVEAIRIAADADYNSGKFMLHLAQSNGDQGVYISCKSGVPDEAQRSQITQMIREKRELQNRGVFRPVFITGDISVEDPKVRSADAAFLEGRRLSHEEIFIGLGVPPSMAAAVAQYSVGSASDRYLLIEESCKPLGARICGGVSFVASRLIGATVSCELCWDEHSTMQQVRAERLKAADGLWAKGMPLAAASDYLNLGLPRFAGDDVGYLPIAVAPVESLPGPGTPSDYSEPSDSIDPEDAEIIEPLQDAIGAIRQKMARTQSSDAALWAAHRRHRQQSVNTFRSSFSRVLMAARAEVLAKLAKAQSGPPLRSDPQTSLLKAIKGYSGATTAPIASQISTRAGAIDFLFDLSAFRTSLTLAMRKATLATLQRAGQQLYDEVGRQDDVYAMAPEKALQFTQTRANKLSGVPDEVHSRIQNQIAEGLDAGDPLSKIADRVRGEFNAIDKGRGLTIAQTETGAAYGYARQAAMDDAGIRFKRWLTSGAPNVRAAHREAQGQTVANDEPFEVGGESLRYPGDEDGSPGNVINCHCVAIAVSGPEA